MSASNYRIYLLLDDKKICFISLSFFVDIGTEKTLVTKNDKGGRVLTLGSLDSF